MSGQGGGIQLLTEKEAMTPNTNLIEGVAVLQVSEGSTTTTTTTCTGPTTHPASALDDSVHIMDIYFMDSLPSLHVPFLSGHITFMFPPPASLLFLHAMHKCS